MAISRDSVPISPAIRTRNRTRPLQVRPNRVLPSLAIGTQVERTSRFTMLLRLPPASDHDAPKVKNGPPVTGHGAEAVRDAITAAISELPGQLRRIADLGRGRPD